MSLSETLAPVTLAYQYKTLSTSIVTASDGLFELAFKSKDPISTKLYSDTSAKNKAKISFAI
jgi:hypothetical protein